MSSERMRRVDEAIREVIGEALSGELKDPRVGFVTVTDVRTSADLRHARVFVSVLGEDSSRQETLEGLASAHGYLQQRIAGELHLKRTPSLTFSYDDTSERAMRLDALIDAALQEGEHDDERPGKAPDGGKHDDERPGMEPDGDGHDDERPDEGVGKSAR